MGMSMGLRQMQTCSLRPELKQIVVLHYRDAGDLELLSLHRIRHRIDSLSVHPDVRKKLVLELMRENQSYREANDKEWYCVTPNALDRATAVTKGYLEDITRSGVMVQDNERIKAVLWKVLSGKINEQDRTIRQWFMDNYDSLIYDTNGKIPYPIVMGMRGQLSKWAIGQTNPFSQPIGEFIEETARSVGLDPEAYDGPDEIWEKLKGFD